MKQPKQMKQTQQTKHAKSTSISATASKTKKAPQNPSLNKKRNNSNHNLNQKLTSRRTQWTPITRRASTTICSRLLGLIFLLLRISSSMLLNSNFGQINFMNLSESFKQVRVTKKQREAKLGLGRRSEDVPEQHLDDDAERL